MKYIILALLLMLGTSCTEEERQQMQMDRETEYAKIVQESMFFFQEKESQLCFAVIVINDYNITHVPCEPVKGMLIH